MLPTHVAFIMDGNGRWAQAHGLERNAGHRAGTENIRAIIRHSKDLGIRYLTFYAFSSENFSRPPGEVGFLMKLIPEYFSKEIPELIREGARIKIIGDLTQFSKPIQFVLRQAEKQTENNDVIQLNFALAYGSRQELFQAFRRMAEDGLRDIDEESFSQYLYTKDIPDPDLIIRTSGEIRLSNFLLYQSAYSELYFTALYWPDFDVKAYDEALESYSNRTRRFGGLNDASENH